MWVFSDPAIQKVNSLPYLTGHIILRFNINTCQLNYVS